MQLFFYWIDPEIALFIFLCHLEFFWNVNLIMKLLVHVCIIYYIYYALFLHLMRTMYKKVSIKKEDLGNMSDKKKKYVVRIYPYLTLISEEWHEEVFFWISLLVVCSYFLCTIFSYIMIWPWKKKRGSLQVYCHKIIWCASWNF